MSAETPYRRLLRQTPGHGIVLLDAAGVVIDVNAAAADLLGVGEHDAIGRDAGWVLERLEAAAGTALIVVDATEAPPSSSPPEGESRFALALAGAPVFVFNQDRDLRYVWVPTAMPGLGAPEGVDPIGRTDAELLGAAGAAELTALKRDAIDHGAVRRGEVVVVHEGAMSVFDVTVAPVHDGEGDGPVSGITCTAIDVTARWRIEDELRQSREMLAEAEHLARMGSWEWDVVRDEIRWSDGLYEIYGLTPETFDARWAARGQREQRVHPDDLERVEAAVARALETGSAIEMEYRIVRPDGRVRRVHSRAEVLFGEDGRPVRMAGTAQDVTEIRAAEEALERTAAELGRRAAELHQVTRLGPAAVRDIAELLTARQIEILGLIAEGLSNLEIAARLYLSETTIKWHVRQILRKLRVANRAEAVAQYMRTSAGTV